MEEGDLLVLPAQHHQYRVHQFDGLGDEIPPQDGRHLTNKAHTTADELTGRHTSRVVRGSANGEVLTIAAMIIYQ